MALQERHAVVVWNGTLRDGSGTVDASSGALHGLPVTFSARTENADGKTSPEELLAAAHAICYAMSCSSTLTKAGWPPTQLVVNATCSLDRKPEGGLKITRMELDVRGHVPDITADGFQSLVIEAEKNCPVSQALRNNVEIRVTAHLDR